MKNIRYSIVSTFIRKMSFRNHEKKVLRGFKYWPVFDLRVANPGFTGAEKWFICKFFTKHRGQIVDLRSAGNLVYLFCIHKHQ